MLRYAVRQLRQRLGRSFALLLAVWLATSSFVLLSGSVETTSLQVRGTVERNFRSPYDLLVRPPSSYTDPERHQGLVRANYQSGIFGGITMAQLAQIRRLPGVELAAPVGNIGYVPFSTLVRVPLASYLNGDQQQLFRVRPRWTTDHGLSTFVGAPSYLYYSRNQVRIVPSVAYTRGDERFRTTPTIVETVPGQPKPVTPCTN